MSESCTERVNHSYIKVEENKRKAVFRNPNRTDYEKTKIDGCLVKDGVRCDYLVTELNSASVLVELKGTDVEHACDQLLKSVERHEVRALMSAKFGFLVVCSRYPSFDTFVAKAKQTCARRYKAGFHVVSDKRELDIVRVTEIDGPY